MWLAVWTSFLQISLLSSWARKGKSCVGHGQLSALSTTTAHEDRARTRGGFSGAGRILRETYGNT